MRRILLTVLLAAIGMTAPLLAAPPGSPRADYRFGNLSGGVVANSSGTMSALTFYGTGDVSAAGGLMALNLSNTCVCNFQSVTPGAATYGRTGTFTGNFHTTGTIGIRLKSNAFSQQGITSPILSFRSIPDPNDYSWGPLQLDFLLRDLSDPYMGLLFRFGPLEWCRPGCMYLESEQVNYPVLPLDPEAGEFNVIVTWSPTTLAIIVNDGTPVTLTRTIGHDASPTDFEMLVGYNASMNHGGEYNYFGGWMRRLVLYDTVLNATDITTLNTALSEDVAAPTVRRRGRNRLR